MTRRHFLAFVGGVLAMPSCLWATGRTTRPQWQMLKQTVRGYTCECRYRIDRRKIQWLRGGKATIDWSRMAKSDADGDFPELVFDGYKVFFR